MVFEEAELRRAHREIDRLRAELAQAQNDLAEMSHLPAANAAKDARIAELEPRGAIADLVSNLRGRIVELLARAEKAEAAFHRSVEKIRGLEDACEKIHEVATNLHARAKRAEAERDALRGALEKVAACSTHPISIARAALTPSSAGREGADVAT